MSAVNSKLLSMELSDQGLRSLLKEGAEVGSFEEYQESSVHDLLRNNFNAQTIYLASENSIPKSHRAVEFNWKGKKVHYDPLLGMVMRDLGGSSSYNPNSESKLTGSLQVQRRLNTDDEKFATSSLELLLEDKDLSDVEGLDGYEYTDESIHSLYKELLTNVGWKDENDHVFVYTVDDSEENRDFLQEEFDEVKELHVFYRKKLES